MNLSERFMRRSATRFPTSPHRGLKPTAPIGLSLRDTPRSKRRIVSIHINHLVHIEQSATEAVQRDTRWILRPFRDRTLMLVGEQSKRRP